MLITIAAALYKKHHDAEKKNNEIKDLAHDGNFTLPDPDKLPSIPENVEAGQHWRIGVDPAAKGARHHDDELLVVTDMGDLGDEKREEGRESERSSVDELWDEVASMVDCPTPNPRDYGNLKRGWGSVVSSRSGLQRSQTGKMSVMSAASTDSWTSRYSQMTDGRRYSEEVDETVGVNLRFF